MKALSLALCFWLTSAFGVEPALKPEAQTRIQKNVQTLGQNIDRARKNLAAATHNIDVLTAELAALDKLQKEHETLKAKYAGVQEKGADPEKAKALQKGIQDGLNQIEAQRAPLQKQLASWKERQKNYDAKLGEFEKKREELEAPPQLITPED